METLKYLKVDGYKNIFLSNHIPELPEIIEILGIIEYADICISSANVRFEEPNSRICRHAIELTDNLQEVWMVGDNLKADDRGAEAVGMKVILVRKPVNGPVKYFSPDLKSTIQLLKQENNI